jgi:hypothetical protein
MKRSLLTLAALFAVSSLALAGCGAQPTGVTPLSAGKTSKSASSLSAGSASAAAPAATGTLVLNLSALAGASALELTLSGPGLAKSLVKKFSAAELATSNVVTFEGVPAAKLHVSLKATAANGQALAAKATDVTVAADGETDTGLDLKLGAAGLAMTLTDGALPSATSALTQTQAPAQTTSGASGSTGSATGAASAPADAAAGDEQGLGIEIVDKAVVKKLLVLKKLAVTVKVTNHNTTTALSGEVKVDYYYTPGVIGNLLQRDVKLVETLTQQVENLAPGKSTTITLTSTKSADDAKATVHTVLMSASADE